MMNILLKLNPIQHYKIYSEKEQVKNLFYHKRLLITTEKSNIKNRIVVEENQKDRK